MWAASCENGSSDICSQCSSRSACASAQSDLRATLAAEGSTRPYFKQEHRETGHYTPEGCSIYAGGKILSKFPQQVETKNSQKLRFVCLSDALCPFDIFKFYMNPSKGNNSRMKDDMRDIWELSHWYAQLHINIYHCWKFEEIMLKNKVGVSCTNNCYPKLSKGNNSRMKNDMRVISLICTTTHQYLSLLKVWRNYVEK